MRKTLSVALAALTLAGGVTGAGAANARDHRYYDGRYDHRDRNNNDTALVAGIAGLAIGAALASGGGHDRYYDNGYRGSYYRQGYYDRGYYARPGYAYGYGPPPPRRCRSFTQWDPYADAYIRRTTCW